MSTTVLRLSNDGTRLSLGENTLGALNAAARAEAAEAGVEADRIAAEVAKVAAQAAQTTVAALADAASGSITNYNTKTAAAADLAGIAADAHILVLADEGEAGARTIYQKSGGVLVLRANLSRLLEYTGTLTSSGANGIRTAHLLGSILDATGRDNRADFNMGRARAFFPAGHGGSTAPYNYYDDTAFIGTNVQQDGNRQNLAMPSLGMFWEPMFWLGSHFFHEWQFRYQDRQGNDYRPFQMLLQHERFEVDGTTILRGVSNVQFQTDRINFHDLLDDQQVVFDLHSKTVDYSPGMVQRFTGNNEAFQSQTNAAGTASLALPYIDANDHERHVTAPVTGTVTASSGDLGHAAFGWQSDGHVPNGYHVFFNAVNEVAGVLTTQFAANATFYDVLFSNAKAGGAVRQQLQSNAGDITSMFWSGGSVAFTFGLHHASGELRFTPEYGGLTGAQGFSMRHSDARVEFAAPIKKASYTVAGLPDPAAMGAGAEAFCTNETGGAVPVFSDGTNWRRVTDRAIAS